MRRLSLISLIAALAAALALGACGEGGGGGGDPRETIDAATLQGIESGVVEMALVVDAPGKEGGDLDLSLSGPFEGGAKGELPRLDLDATVKGSAAGEDLDFEGGLLLLPDTAYVNYEGTEYEVDALSFSIIEPILNPSAGGGPGASEGSIGCQKAVGELRVSSFVDNLRGGEGVEVEGTDTTKVSGDLDVPGALDALLDLTEDPACKAQVSSAGEPPSRAEVEDAKKEIEQGLKSARIDVYVGEDDIVRRISAHLEIEPRRRSGGGGPRRASVDFELTLSGVNEEQDIAAPGRSKPLNDLFLKLGINPLELLGLLEGEGLTELIEGIGSAATGSGGGASQQEYAKCLGNVRSPVDLQKCMRLGR